MKELNPEAINSILNILTFFSYTTILFGLVFLFYFIRYEFLGHELTRQQKIRALIFLLASIAPNFVISFVAQKLDAGLYVNFGIFFFALSCVSAKAVFKKNYKIFGEIPFDKWYGIAFLTAIILNCALIYTTIYKLHVEPANVLFKILNYGFLSLMAASIIIALLEKLFKSKQVVYFLKWVQIPITSLAFANIAVSAFFMFLLFTAPAMDALSHAYSPISGFVKVGKTEINTRAFGKEEILFLEGEVNSGKDPEQISDEFLKKYTTFYKNNAE